MCSDGVQIFSCNVKYTLNNLLAVMVLLSFSKNPSVLVLSPDALILDIPQLPISWYYPFQ